MTKDEVLRNTCGHAQNEYIAVLSLVGIVGIGAFAAFGGAFDDALVGSTGGSAPSIDGRSNNEGGHPTGNHLPPGTNDADAADGSGTVATSALAGLAGGMDEFAKWATRRQSHLVDRLEGALRAGDDALAGRLRGAIADLEPSRDPNPIARVWARETFGQDTAATLGKAGDEILAEHAALEKAEFDKAFNRLVNRHSVRFDTELSPREQLALVRDLDEDFWVQMDRDRIRLRFVDGDPSSFNYNRLRSLRELWISSSEIGPNLDIRARVQAFAMELGAQGSDQASAFERSVGIRHANELESPPVSVWRETFQVEQGLDRYFPNGQPLGHYFSEATAPLMHQVKQHGGEIHVSRSSPAAGTSHTMDLEAKVLTFHASDLGRTSPKQVESTIRLFISHLKQAASE
ncbi:MAG: hypothetical protein KC416_07170 [Myxococcales bacterium]|nr:hypothetical protein [Myxococcales bacterium]